MKTVWLLLLIFQNTTLLGLMSLFLFEPQDFCSIQSWGRLQWQDGILNIGHVRLLVHLLVCALAVGFKHGDRQEGRWFSVTVKCRACKKRHTLMQIPLRDWEVISPLSNLFVQFVSGVRSEQLSISVSAHWSNSAKQKHWNEDICSAFWYWLQAVEKNTLLKGDFRSQFAGKLLEG